MDVIIIYMPDHARMAQYYEDLLSKHGDHYLSLDWKNPDSQKERYQIFEDLINMFDKKNGCSILDIGSGFGDLYGYLKKKGYKFDYAGYDIAPKLIEMARKKFPGTRFEVRDILNDPCPERADFVFCCGALNISFAEIDEHLEFIRSMLLRMFELCKIGVGVNFLSSQAIYFLPVGSERAPQYFYANPEDIVKFAKGMATRFVIRHDYHPGDFTVYLMK